MFPRVRRFSWWKSFLTSQRLALILTGATIVLALWGFALDKGPGDSVYNTIRLFNVDVDPTSDDSWQIQMARFLAPVALAYAFLVALATVLRTQLQGFRVRHFFRDHVVVVGLGRDESLVARQLRDDESFQIVGVEIDETSGAINGLRASGVPVVVGDARDPEVLGQVNPEKAAHIIVFTGDDSTNIEVLATLSMVIRDDRDVTVHVVIDSPFLWNSLHRFQFSRGDRRRRIEFICLPDRAAGLLVDAAEVEKREQASGTLTRVAIAGESAIAARIVVQLVRSPVFESVQEITVLLESADELQKCSEMLRETEPWVFRRTDVKFDLMKSLDSAHPATALGFIVGLNEADTLAAVLRMRRQIGPGARILAGVSDPDTAAAADEIGTEFGLTDFVSVGETVEGAHLMYGSAREIIARGRHKVYVRERLAAGETVSTNASLVNWEDLPASLRDSNRNYADGVAKMLGRIGADLVPLEGSNPAPFKLDPDLLEELAREEHDRWCEDLSANGWKYTSGSKDPNRKLHPLLTSWEELGEEERNKDRESILALPEVLAAVGYGLSPR